MRNLVVVAGLALLAAGCTEKIPNTTVRVEGSDTTYVGPVEAPLARRVLLEEFTGVTCPNCPAGHTIVANLQTQNPERVIAVSYYSEGLPQARPVEGLTKEDFRTVDATEAGSAVFGGVGGLPTAAIDRVPIDNAMLTTSNRWAGAVASRLGVASPANLTISSSWESTDRRAVIKVRASYTSAVAKKQALTLILVESDIVDAQEYPTTIDSTYTFKHVLRDIITSTTGEPILTGVTIEPGRVYERTFVYGVSEKWNAENCSLIAVLHNADNGDMEVVQAAEEKLKQ